MNPKKIYISGKITGLSLETASHNFQIAEDYLRSIGYTDIINPIKIHPENNTYTWSKYMKEDIKVLVDSDIVFILPNAKYSRGAQIEIALATDLGLTIIPAPLHLKFKD